MTISERLASFGSEKYRDFPLYNCGVFAIFSGVGMDQQSAVSVCRAFVAGRVSTMVGDDGVKQNIERNENDQAHRAEQAGARQDDSHGHLLDH